MKESITPSGEPYVPKCEDTGKGSHRNRHKHGQDVRPQIHIPGVDEGFVGDPKSYTTWESPFGRKKEQKSTKSSTELWRTTIHPFHGE